MKGKVDLVFNEKERVAPLLSIIVSCVFVYYYMLKNNPNQS